MATKQGSDREAYTDAPDQSEPGETLREPSPARLNRAARRRMLNDVRNRVWSQLPFIAEALIEGAKAGSVTHLKVLMELGAFEKGMLESKPVVKKEKSMETLLVERWRKIQAERAASEETADDAG